MGYKLVCKFYLSGKETGTKYFNYLSSLKETGKKEITTSIKLSKK